MRQQRLRKHRGFVSFGPKKFWGATVASELGEGEFPETFRERALGRPRRPWQAGRRYSEDEIKQFRLDEQQRPRVSDVAGRRRRPAAGRCF